MLELSILKINKLRLERLSAFIPFEDWTSGSWKEMVINANMTPGFYVPPMWQASHHFHHPGEFKDGRAWPGETSTPSDTGIFQCMKPLHLSKETSLFLTLWNIPLLFTVWRFNIRRKITFPPTEWCSWMRYWDEEDPILRLQVVKMRKCSEKADTLLDHSLGDAQDAHLLVVPSKVPIIRPSKPW